MRALFASVLQTPCLYFVDIPATDVLSIRFVMVAVRLLWSTNIQRPRVVAMPSMPGVLLALLIRKAASFAVPEAFVHRGVVRKLKACIESCIPVLALGEVAKV
jgi:hypothetical protein